MVPPIGYMSRLVSGKPGPATLPTKVELVGRGKPCALRTDRRERPRSAAGFSAWSSRCGLWGPARRML